MNDAAVKAIWKGLDTLEERIVWLELKVDFLKGQVKARLKEEAEARKSRVWQYANALSGTKNAEDFEER